MNDLVLALRQVRFENRAFWRNPPAAFFTVAFPLLFMIIFGVIFGSEAARFLTPAIIVFAVLTATFTNLAMNITFARDLGILKRIRGTPLPPWAYLAGRIGHAVLVALLLVVVVAGFGALVYDVPVPWATLPLIVGILALAAAAFSALGLALTGVIPNADAAPAIVNIIVLPLLFVSNVFIQMDTAPDWLNTVSRIFPVRHLADAAIRLYQPGAEVAVPWTEMAVIAAWGVAGVVAALLFFRWEPRR